MKDLPTQNDFVLRMLLNKKVITAHQMSVKYGIDRLSAVIYVLRKQGYHIESEYITKKSKHYKGYMTYAKYFLKSV